tara:strand:+ start:957 stop:1568 length:612 start_codon:yes stop_codon:yes gene_type:complete
MPRKQSKGRKPKLKNKQAIPPNTSAPVQQAPIYPPPPTNGIFRPSGTGFWPSFFNNLYSVNNSKFFAGVIMLTMNIASKHMTIEISKSQEAYVKYSLGRQILIFAVLWMGTRDIVIALTLTAIFILLADYLFNENSKFCVLPDKYKQLHKLLDKDGDGKISEKEINNAISILKKAKEEKHKKTNKTNHQDNWLHKNLVKENFI